MNERSACTAGERGYPDDPVDPARTSIDGVRRIDWAAFLAMGVLWLIIVAMLIGVTRCVERSLA